MPLYKKVIEDSLTRVMPRGELSKAYDTFQYTILNEISNGAYSYMRLEINLGLPKSLIKPFVDYLRFNGFVGLEKGYLNEDGEVTGGSYLAPSSKGYDELERLKKLLDIK